MSVYLDCETSGKQSPDAHIIEVAGVVLDRDFREIDHFETLANPGEEAIGRADPEALAVNRITPEMIRSAPPVEEAAAALNRFLDRHWGSEIHAFHNQFDHWFLACPPWNVRSVHWGECVMLAAYEMMGKAGALIPFGGGKFKWPNLEEAARFFGVRFEGGHRALPDVRVTARIHAAIHMERMNRMADDEVKHFIEQGM